jgi:hypothetical protein
MTLRREGKPPFGNLGVHEITGTLDKTLEQDLELGKNLKFALGFMEREFFGEQGVLLRAPGIVGAAFFKSRFECSPIQGFGWAEKAFYYNKIDI